MATPIRVLPCPNARKKRTTALITFTSPRRYLRGFNTPSWHKRKGKKHAWKNKI